MSYIKFFIALTLLLVACFSQASQENCPPTKPDCGKSVEIKTTH